MRHLRYVVATAESGSFRRAAKALRVQESAVSRRVRDLEDELGVALFIRHHSGVRPTPAGTQFLIRARAALDQIARATIDAASFGRGELGLVRIGIFTSLATGFLAELLRTYVGANPSVRPEIVEGGPATHVAAIQRFDLDVAFLVGEPKADGCDLIHLWDEQVFVVLPENDQLGHRQAMSWKDLRDRRFIVSETDPGPVVHDYLLKHLADLGHHPRVERQAVGRDNLMNLVAMGQGLTLTSEAATAATFPGVLYRPLLNAVLPFYAIWSPQNGNPALRRLLSLARSMSKAALPCLCMLLSSPELGGLSSGLDG